VALLEPTNAPYGPRGTACRVPCPPPPVCAKQVALLLLCQGLARLAVMVLAPLEKRERQQRLQPTGPCPLPLLFDHLGRHPLQVDQSPVPRWGLFFGLGRSAFAPYMLPSASGPCSARGKYGRFLGPRCRELRPKERVGGCSPSSADPPFCDNGPSIEPLLQLHPPSGGTLAPYPPV
jgi:hypothetical protein